MNIGTFNAVKEAVKGETVIYASINQRSLERKMREVVDLLKRLEIDFRSHTSTGEIEVGSGLIKFITLGDAEMNVRGRTGIVFFDESLQSMIDTVQTILLCDAAYIRKVDIEFEKGGNNE